MFHVKHFGTIDGPRNRTFGRRGQIRSEDLAQAENRDRFELFPCGFYKPSFRNLVPKLPRPGGSVLREGPLLTSRHEGACAVLLQFILRR
jgi:hypothetical protein